MTLTDASTDQYDADIDISADRCPMTYVRVRLALERLQSGQILRVTLQGEEPTRNVPRTASEQGHQVLWITKIGDKINQLAIRRK